MSVPIISFSDYLNYVYDIKNSDKLKVIDIQYKGNEKIFNQVEKMHNDTTSMLNGDRRKYYTIGQSIDRDEYLEKDGRDSKNVPYKLVKNISNK